MVGVRGSVTARVTTLVEAAGSTGGVVGAEVAGLADAPRITWRSQLRSWVASTLAKFKIDARSLSRATSP